MLLDRGRDALIYRHLNDQWYPYSYAEIREAVDFQNALFRQFANHHDLVFIDTARWIPKDPSVFADAIHFNSAGTKIQAWIMLQLLVPVLDKLIKSGALPKPATSEAGFPLFVAGENRDKISIVDIGRSCDAE
jgi:hypothetical protein